MADVKLSGEEILKLLGLTAEEWLALSTAQRDKLIKMAYKEARRRK